MSETNNSANPNIQEQKERKKRRRLIAAIATIAVGLVVGTTVNTFEGSDKPPTTIEATLSPAEQAEQLATNIRGRVVETRTLENPSERIVAELNSGDIPVFVSTKINLTNPDSQSHASSQLLDRKLIFAIGNDSAIARDSDDRAVGINLDPTTSQSVIEPIQSAPINSVENHADPKTDQAGIVAIVGLPEKLEANHFVVVFTQKSARFTDATGEHTTVSTVPIGALLQTSAGNYALAGGGDLEAVIEAAKPTIHTS